jgi:membrane protein implicated in regulation of membrane protease activity
MRSVLSIAALCLALAAPAVAQTPTGTRLTLTDAANAPTRPVIVDGASWRCEGATCTASGGANQPAPRACRRVVARLGAVSEFTWRGTALTAEQLAACNA